jgi:hypothetical protein
MGIYAPIGDEAKTNNIKRKSQKDRDNKKEKKKEYYLLWSFIKATRSIVHLRMHLGILHAQA